MAEAENLRIATYNAGLSRKRPGLLLRDILTGKDPQIAAAQATVIALNADVLVLTGFDFDYDLVALSHFVDPLGVAYPHRFARRPNTGWATELDLDGDGRMGGPGDAQGFGWFAGQGGVAVLSRLPIDLTGFRDFSTFLWRDLPGALPPENMTAEARAVQRLSTTVHWELPLILPDGGRLNLLIWHATPPVFDGPEDRNGRRNHDEAAFWLRLLAGELPMPRPNDPFVLLGDANLDVADGDGRPEAMLALMAHPMLQDPAPRGTSGRKEPDHQGEAALDTALYEGPGGLRVDYILPSAELLVVGAGVLWPPDADPLSATLSAASRHRPVWVDISLP